MKVIDGSGTDENVFTEKNISIRNSSQIHFQRSTDNRTIIVKNSFSSYDRKLVVPDYTFTGMKNRTGRLARTTITSGSLKLIRTHSPAETTHTAPLEVTSI